MAQPVFSATERTFPRRISRRAYAPFCKVHVRFGLLSLLRRVRWIALGALCAKGLWCRNAQANAATVPLMRSLRQYGNVMFDTLALCEYTECRMPTDRVLVSQISIGRRDRESLQQDRKHCQFASLGSARFSCFPFLLRARRAKRSEWWFLKFQSDVGIRSACNRTGNTANPRRLP